MKPNKVDQLRFLTLSPVEEIDQVANLHEGEAIPNVLTRNRGRKRGREEEDENEEAT